MSYYPKAARVRSLIHIKLIDKKKFCREGAHRDQIEVGNQTDPAWKQPEMNERIMPAKFLSNSASAGGPSSFLLLSCIGNAYLL